MQAAFKLLKNSKNLLAFSHGVDSTALFYLLLEKDIDFDLAFVNYNTRLNSKREENAAKTLAKTYKKKLFIKQVFKLEGNFEKAARDARYEFFNELMLEQGYENLVLAHQLNDRFEWLLMQFAKGAGLLELYGMDAVVYKKGYKIIRPLLDVSKDALLLYLHKNSFEFFEDESNESKKYLRNKIRLEFAADFVKQNSSGVRRSFELLGLAKDKLYQERVYEYEGIFICPKDSSLVARAAKELGFLLSFFQRQEAMSKDVVLSHALGVVHFKEKILLFKYEACKGMSKDFKERSRKAGLPAKIRGYFYKFGLDPFEFVDILSTFKLGVKP